MYFLLFYSPRPASRTLSAHTPANSSMSRPLLRLSASNGSMLCWCAGARDAAAGCARESIMRNSGSGAVSVSVSVSASTLTRGGGSSGGSVPSSVGARSTASSSYVKRSGSVRGAYGLKSTMCARVRSRVSSRSNVSVPGAGGCQRRLWIYGSSRGEDQDAQSVML